MWQISKYNTWRAVWHRLNGSKIIIAGREQKHMTAFVSLHAKTHTHTHTRSRAHTQTHIGTYTHTQAHTYAHMRAHTHTYTYTHIHTHMHIYNNKIIIIITIPGQLDKRRMCTLYTSKALSQWAIMGKDEAGTIYCRHPPTTLHPRIGIITPDKFPVSIYRLRGDG